MDNNRKLLPCPFCGSNAVIRTSYIMCEKCYADGPADNPEEIVSAWNRRHQALDEEILKDAKRYRWLREQEAEKGLAILYVGSWTYAATCIATTFPDADQLDSAIDQAMSLNGEDLS